jgi:hypothetical protein
MSSNFKQEHMVSFKSPFLAMLFILALHPAFSPVAQAQATVSDIRLTLLSPESTSLDIEMIRDFAKDPALAKQVYDSVRSPLMAKLGCEKLHMDAGCITYLEGLDSKPYHYKKMAVAEGAFIVILDLSIGISEVMVEDNYEIVAIIRVLDHKKKRVFKDIVSKPMDPTIDGKDGISRMEMEQAFFRSLFEAISSIELVFKQ